MLDFIKEWTVNIVMLVLFIVIIEMLLPRGKMKKYVNLLTGTILIIVIIEPITGLFGKDFDFTASQTAAASNIDKKEIEKAGKLLEEEQLRQTIELYRSRVIEQIAQSAREVEGVKDAQADIIINEDHESEYFGEIKRIYINAVVENTAKEGSSDAAGGNKEGKDSVAVKKVESIKVGGHTGSDPGSVIDDSGSVIDDSGSVIYDAGLGERLTSRIGEVFGVDKEKIIIKQIQR